jgi:hypothetical protein
MRISVRVRRLCSDSSALQPHWGLTFASLRTAVTALHKSMKLAWSQVYWNCENTALQCFLHAFTCGQHFTLSSHITDSAVAGHRLDLIATLWKDERPKTFIALTSCNTAGAPVLKKQIRPLVCTSMILPQILYRALESWLLSTSTTH